MRLIYKFSNLGKSSYKSRQEAIKSTDKAAQAVAVMIKEVGNITGGNKFLIWLLGKAYIRKVTSESIEYHFYLFDWILKLEEKMTKYI